MTLQYNGRWNWNGFFSQERYPQNGKIIMVKRPADYVGRQLESGVPNNVVN